MTDDEACRQLLLNSLEKGDTLEYRKCYTFFPPRMPTSKKRLNLTLPKDLALFLKKISLRDDMPQATKAVQLLERALEWEEGEFKKSFVDEMKRRIREDKKIPFEEVMKELW